MLPKKSKEIYAKLKIGYDQCLQKYKEQYRENNYGYSQQAMTHDPYMNYDAYMYQQQLVYQQMMATQQQQQIP